MAKKRKRPVSPFGAALEGLSLEELQDVAAQVIDLAAHDRRPTPVSRRRKRRSTPATLTLRVDLVDAKPPIWRRVEVPSTLRLDQVHDLVQALFGWTDSHLHRFALGDSVWDDGAELFLCPYDVEEGEDEGVPASTVRLDETFAEEGDRLRYVYDYGDEWTVDLVLEASTPGALTAPRVLEAKGIAPPDDSGGIHSWNDGRQDTPVDIDALRDAVQAAAQEWLLPAPVVQLQRRLAHAPTYQDVVALVAAARLDDDAPADLAEALRQYAWLLDRAGDGLALTQAGYLPPAVVLAAMTELGLARDWIGKGNREDLTRPVADLRRSAQRLGLLRVSKGRLLPTKAGTAAAADPELLARTIAQKAGGLRRGALERELSTLLLLQVAAGTSVEVDASRRFVARVLGDLGWRRADGGPIEPWGLLRRDEDTEQLFSSIGCLERRATPSPGAQTVARMVLRELN